nr:unnamed protein product [Callosobruchus analis]
MENMKEGCGEEPKELVKRWPPRRGSFPLVEGKLSISRQKPDYMSIPKGLETEKASAGTKRRPEESERTEKKVKGELRVTQTINCRDAPIISDRSYGIPEVPYLKLNKNSMMHGWKLQKASFRGNKKSKSGAGLDEVYNFKWFAFKLLMFLKDRNTPRETTELGIEKKLKINTLDFGRSLQSPKTVTLLPDVPQQFIKCSELLIQQKFLKLFLYSNPQFGRAPSSLFRSSNNPVPLWLQIEDQRDKGNYKNILTKFRNTAILAKTQAGRCQAIDSYIGGKK